LLNKIPMGIIVPNGQMNPLADDKMTGFGEKGFLGIKNPLG
jgi:hypothetical protein